MASRVTQKTSTGQPASSPVGPSESGVGPPVCMNPALKRPMTVTKSPMPMVIACLSGRGMPFMIFSRRPETTSSTISRP